MGAFLSHVQGVPGLFPNPNNVDRHFSCTCRPICMTAHAPLAGILFSEDLTSFQHSFRIAQARGGSKIKKVGGVQRFNSLLFESSVGGTQTRVSLSLFTWNGKSRCIKMLCGYMLCFSNYLDKGHHIAVTREVSPGCGWIRPRVYHKSGSNVLGSDSLLLKI